jgi:2-dehydropantoate 2-reductase
VKIGFVGAGGIGSYYGGLLSRAGHDVKLYARGDHLAAICSKGLEVRTPKEKFIARLDASANADVVAHCDVVFVAVKSYSLPEVGPVVAAAAMNGAAIVGLLNGVDIAERLRSLGVPRDRIVGGLVRASIVRSAPGVVDRLSEFDRITVGEFDGAITDRVTRIGTALREAGVTADVSDDISHDLWRKFAFIVPMNVACGLSRRPMGYSLSTERGRALVAGSLHEIVCVARACEVTLTDQHEMFLRNDLFALAPQTRPSFLLDLERGGPTELDLLAGTVSRLGALRGVPTPIHDVAVAAFEAATLPLA